MNIEALLARARELKSEIDSLRPFGAEQERRVWQKFALDWNYHSNALEGNQVTLGETEMFLEYGLTAKGKPFKDYLEIRGHDRAIEVLKDLVRRDEPITEGIIRELHKVLLGDAHEIEAETSDGEKITKVIVPGQYKTQPNHVKMPGGGVHEYVAPLDTPAEMAKLVSWWRKQWETREQDPTTIAVYVHHRFTEIHPFDDGNGRIARLLSNLILMKSGYPPAIIKTERRNEYVFALREADRGNLNSITELLLNELIHSEELLLKAAKGEAIEELDDIDKNILLLKQELKHLDEPLELSPESAVTAFTATIRPLLNTLIQKFSAFEELFAQTKVSLAGNYRVFTGNKLHHQGLPGNAASALSEVVSGVSAMFNGKNITPDDFNLSVEWNGLRKTPTHPLNLSLQVFARFEKLRYTVRVHASSYAWPYGHQASQEDVRKFAEDACTPLIDAIRAHIQAHVRK